LTSNNNHITIKRATIQDAELIADLSRETFYETFAKDNSAEDMDKFMNEQFTREKLVEEVGQPGNIFLLAYNQTEVAGYARLRRSKNPPQFADIPTIEIARIYALGHKIGKGVGSSLIQHCIDIAREEGIQLIWLGVWEKNQRAIDFYSRWGFEKFGEHSFLLGNDAQTDWLMKKAL
jgi:ribosomal protein S18 acetylase RimI-like enzyme